MKGLEKMIEKEEYCMDILVQNLAIQKSLGSLNKLVLENHLKTHIAAKLSAPDAKSNSDALNELLELYEISSVRGK